MYKRESPKSTKIGEFIAIYKVEMAKNNDSQWPAFIYLHPWILSRLGRDDIWLLRCLRAPFNSSETLSSESTCMPLAWCSGNLWQDVQHKTVRAVLFVCFLSGFSILNIKTLYPNIMYCFHWVFIVFLQCVSFFMVVHLSFIPEDYCWHCM